MNKHEFLIAEKLETKLSKTYKKDKRLYNTIMTKIEEVTTANNIMRYKNLKAPLQEFKRVHIMKNFVLIFKYDKENNIVRFHDFDYHDNIY